MASEFERDRIKSDFLNLTFVADEYEINFDKLSEGEEEDQYTGKFRVRSRSVPAYGSLEEGEERRRSSSIGAMGRKSRNSARNSERTSHMSSRRSTDSANAEVQGSDSSAKGRRSSLQSRGSGVERSSVHSPRSSSVPPRQGISMVFSEDDRMSLQSSGEEPRDSLTGKRHSSLGAGIGRGRESQALENGSNMQRLSRISEEVISSGASQTEASEEWCTKTLTSRSLHKVSKKDAEMMDPKKMDVIVTAKDSVNFETVPLVEVRSSSSHGIRSHGTMEWIPGHTLHFDVPKEVKQHVEIHLELLPFGNPPQGIIDGKMALDVAEKYEQVPLKSGALGIQVRMKPGKQRGTKKGLKWHPEVRDGRTFAGGNRRNTPFQPLYPIAETPDGNAETRMSEGRISDPSVSEVRVPDPRMSQKSMLEDRVSAPRMSEGGTSAPRISEARMSDCRMSDPRMSEARMSEGRMSDLRMSEARMSEGRMSDPRMSEARMSEGRMSDPRMSEGRMSDPRMSEARMSEGRMSDPRMSEARMSDGRMSDPRMSEARMSDGRMSDPRMSEARMSEGRMSDPRMSEARFSEGRMSDPRMSEARMSEGRMSDPRMSEARMSEARMSDPRMSEARFSEGRMSDPRMSEAMVSGGRLSDPRMSEARMSEGRMSDPRMSEARMSDGRMSSDPRMSEARMSDPRMSEAMVSGGRLSDPRMSEARMSQGSMPRASQTRASDARASDVQFSPSVASMQLDVAEMEARNTVRSNPRYSNRMSASSARASLADRRSTARSSIAVKMQQDPGDATDSSLASINDHRESTERMSLGASLQAQSGSIYSPYVEDAPKRSLRGSQSMPCSMPMASDSEKTSDSQNSQIPSPMVAASEDGSRQGESLGELSQSRTSRSSVPRTSRTSQSRRMSSRASRLSKAKNESTGGTARAVCRFTHPEAVNFCGLEIVACKCQEAENLAGRDRSALLVLLEQAGKSVEAARQMKGSDAAAMPRLVAHLSSELTLHGRELRAGRLQAVGSEPVFLAVLSQLIEVLDTLVPLPNLPENSLVLGKDWSLGGEIRPQYTESLLESLRQAFGSHGFLPECVECLRCINQTELPYVVMDELKLVTLLALRLALAWDTPSTVQRPLEVMIECKGYEVLLDHLLQLIASFKGDVSETTLPQLALALEAVYLMLCSDSGLEQLCGSESKVRSNNARKTSPLAAVALDTIELLAQGWKEATHAVNSVLPAAVNILALLLNATPMALAASTDQIVRALCQIISHETLTPRLISSMLQLVRPPQKPRIWLGSVGDAVQIRKKLRQSLIRNKVPSMVAIAAKEKLETLLQQHGELSLSLNGPVSKAVEKRASQVIAAGSYYDNVEAFVSEVYGSAGAVDVEEEMADFRNAVDDLDDDVSRADRRRSSMLMSALSNMRQAIFENCLMPQTRRRSSRVV